jgi:hypothetical protein
MRPSLKVRINQPTDKLSHRKNRANEEHGARPERNARQISDVENFEGSRSISGTA